MVGPRRFLTLSICIVSAVLVNAQDFKHAAGVRLGHTSAVQYKNMLANGEALELMVSGRKDGLQLTTLYSFHKPLQFAFNENFFVYYGLGAHVGYEEHGDLDKVLTSVEPRSFEFRDKSFFVMGADAILGLEYRWFAVPMTIGFDIKPYFTFIGMRYTDLQFWDAGVSLKYIF
ncbi:MAG: hypothetical protein AAGA85_04250 [Bacteroidota bacterium]